MRPSRAKRARGGWRIRLVRGTPPAGRVDHALLGVSLFGVLLLAAWSLPWWGNALPWPAPCPYLRLTGHPCLFCGGTRAWGLLARGAWAAAFRLNPLAALLGLGFAAYAAGALAALLTGWRLGLARGNAGAPLNENEKKRGA